MKLQGQAENTPYCYRMTELMDLRQWLRTRAENRRKLSTQAPFGYCATARQLIHQDCTDKVAEKRLKEHLCLVRACTCDPSIFGLIIVAAEMKEHAKQHQPCRLSLANSSNSNAIDMEARGMMAFGSSDPIVSVSRSPVTGGFRTVREIISESGYASFDDFMAYRNRGSRVGHFNLARFLEPAMKGAR